MPPLNRRPEPPAAGCVSLRIAVVSPFIDRRHGTERAIAELVERLAMMYGCEVHLFAQHVDDLAVVTACPSADDLPGRVSWHRIPTVPGPQLFRFAAWLILNRVRRSAHRFDLILSPGINCFDAD